MSDKRLHCYGNVQKMTNESSQKKKYRDNLRKTKKNNELSNNVIEYLDNWTMTT